MKNPEASRNRGELMKKNKDVRNNACTVFYDETRDEAYQRYKKRQYRNLVLKALLFFLLGLFCGFLGKLIQAVFPG